MAVMPRESYGPTLWGWWEHGGDIAVLHLDGELDGVAEPALRQRLAAVEERSLTVDLSRVSFVDLGGLRILVCFAEGDDRTVTIEDPPPTVHVLLDVFDAFGERLLVIDREGPGS